LEIEEIYEELKKVKEPISGEDIISLGIVSLIRKEDNKMIIFLGLARRTPRHPFEMAVNWAVHARMIKDIVKVLEGKVNFEIIDDMTFQKYYPIKEV